MLELLNFGHVTTHLEYSLSQGLKFLVTPWTEIMMS